MEKKAFKLGIIVGRFQTFHTGHEYMVNKACAVCDRVGVLVGSSQESGTAKNPYSYELRKKMLRQVFGNAVSIHPLPDIGVGNNATWGNYVLQNVRQHFQTAPDLLISGKEARRLDWFDSVQGLTVAELYVPKTIEISATQMRGYLIDDDRESWQRYTPQALWSGYEELRKAVLASKDILETSSM